MISLMLAYILIAERLELLKYFVCYGFWCCCDCFCYGDYTDDSCPSDCLDLTDCVNDDSIADQFGDTCSSWYDTNEELGSYGCNGGYDTDDFSAAEQCCVCGGGSYDDGGDDDNTCEDLGGNSNTVSDGVCDEINNINECGYDGGDCCPSDCDNILCEDYGGNCATCVDPDSVHKAPGSQCNTTCDDCVADCIDDGYSEECANSGCEWWDFSPFCLGCAQELSSVTE